MSADGASFVRVRAGFSCVECKRDIVMFGIWFGVGGVNSASCIIMQRLLSDIFDFECPKAMRLRCGEGFFWHVFQFALMLSIWSHVRIRCLSLVG